MSLKREIITHSSDETIARGRELGNALKPPALILLSGDLGQGKTTLTKGIASGLGAADEDEVTSPTFTLVHKYDRGVRVYHVDLYRIGDSHDLDTLGLEDVFTERAIVIVEWPRQAHAAHRLAHRAHPPRSRRGRQTPHLDRRPRQHPPPAIHRVYLTVEAALAIPVIPSGASRSCLSRVLCGREAQRGICSFVARLQPHDVESGVDVNHVARHAAP